MRILKKALLIGAFVALTASTGIKHLVGIASVYHNKFQNKKTASGEKFKQENYTCASNNFSLGTMLRVTNIDTGCYVIVKVNDRMAISSQIKGRIVDLSRVAMQAINGDGLIKVKAEIINI